MRLADLLVASTETLRRNRSRSALTVLGIVIGIAAVIVMLSVGRSAEGYILGQVADLGADQIFIEPAHGDQAGGPPSPFVDQTITLDDAEALRSSDAFSVVSSTIMMTTSVVTDEAGTFAHVMGVEEFELQAFPAEVAAGRFLDEADVDGAARVIVLGVEIAGELFGDVDPVGERVTVKGTRFRVIGVMEPRGTLFFQNLDRTLYMPISTMQHQVMNVDYVNYVTLRAAIDVDDAMLEAKEILREQHDINNPDGDASKDDFFISSREDAVAIIGGIGTVLSVLLAAIASISLIVGGIGIMNIMLVSVTERTREIGLRKAIGATARDIATQFLVEAVLLTLAGGVLGVMLGVGVAFGTGLVAAQFIDGWKAVVPLGGIVLAVSVSGVVGIVFGLYPARRAALLDPIDALRYE